MKIRNGFMVHPVFLYLLKRYHDARPLTETNKVQNEIAIHKFLPKGSVQCTLSLSTRPFL